MKTFREIYCEHHGIGTGSFERVLLWRCLHWPARPLHWLLRLNRDYYTADYEFIRGVGDLRSRRDFRTEVADFHSHPRNRGFLRTTLRIRASSQKLQEIFEREVTAADSSPPMTA